MDPVLVLVAFTVVIGFGLAFTNGFHDAGDAVATSITTRALTPRVALAMAAGMNAIGAVLGGLWCAEFARMLVLRLGGGGSILDFTGVSEWAGDATEESTWADSGNWVGAGSDAGAPAGILAMLTVVTAGALAALIWNLITWWRGLPTSSLHALVGGLAGAAAVNSALHVNWETVGLAVAVPMVAVPALSFLLAYLALRGVRVVARGVSNQLAQRRFRAAQTISSAAMALVHGLQDSFIAISVIAFALHVGGYCDGGAPAGEAIDVVAGVPLWVMLGVAVALAAGTYAGGWRIIKTLGGKITNLDAAQGFTAQTTAAVIVYGGTGIGTLLGIPPASTSQATAAAIAGVGAAERSTAVRWDMFGSIVLAWLATIPGVGLIGAGVAYAAALVV